MSVHSTLTAGQRATIASLERALMQKPGVKLESWATLIGLSKEKTGQLVKEMASEGRLSLRNGGLIYPPAADVQDAKPDPSKGAAYSEAYEWGKQVNSRGTPKFAEIAPKGVK